jgi:Xaa-Pro dipeptidase
MGSKTKRRIERIFGGCSGLRQPESILVYNRDHVDHNFLYLTGLSGGVFENCGALCEKDGRLILFSTTLEEEMLRGAEGYSQFFVYRDKENRNDVLKKALSPYERIGISFDSTPHGLYISIRELMDGVELVDVSEAFKRARMIKTKEEAEKIRRACEIASSVAEDFPNLLKPGVRERDLASEVDYRMRKLGARRAAFETIVAFSPNNSKPHYSGGDVALRKGDAVLLDFGAEFEGYVSDITRSYLTGNPKEDLRHCYETVLQAQRIALDLICDGSSSEEVEKEVKSFIDSNERYRGRFIHGLGHSIGLSVHDNSYPGIDFDKKFRENMVLTVEPGIYLPGEYGIRIEDDIIVRRGGSEILTTAAKEPYVYEI